MTGTVCVNSLGDVKYGNVVGGMVVVVMTSVVVEVEVVVTSVVVVVVVGVGVGGLVSRKEQAFCRKDCEDCKRCTQR